MREEIKVVVFLVGGMTVGFLIGEFVLKGWLY